MCKFLVSAVVAISISTSIAIPFAYGQSMTAAQRNVTFSRGVAAIKARQYANAITEFTSLIASDPSNGEYYALRGSAFYDSANYPRAKQDFEDAIKRHFNKPVIYEQLNMAVSHTIMPPKTYPGETVGSMFGKAQSAFKNGDYPTSVGVFTLLLDKSMPANVQQASYMGRAESFLKMGRKENARIDAQSAINHGLDVPQSRDLLKRASQ